MTLKLLYVVALTIVLVSSEPPSSGYGSQRGIDGRSGYSNGQNSFSSDSSNSYGNSGLNSVRYDGAGASQSSDPSSYESSSLLGSQSPYSSGRSSQLKGGFTRYTANSADDANGYNSRASFKSGAYGSNFSPLSSSGNALGSFSSLDNYDSGRNNYQNGYTASGAGSDGDSPYSSGRNNFGVNRNYGGIGGARNGNGGYDSGDEDPLSEPANYEFSYEVDVPEDRLQFGHRESRDGDETNGLYHVLLPDGRTQIVEYRADQDGYKPVVTYQDSNNGAGNNGNDFRNGQGGGAGTANNGASSAGGYGFGLNSAGGYSNAVENVDGYSNTGADFLNKNSGNYGSSATGSLSGLSTASYSSGSSGSGFGTGIGGNYGGSHGRYSGSGGEVGSSYSKPSPGFGNSNLYSSLGNHNGGSGYGHTGGSSSLSNNNGGFGSGNQPSGVGGYTNLRNLGSSQGYGQQNSAAEYTAFRSSQLGVSKADGVESSSY